MTSLVRSRAYGSSNTVLRPVKHRDTATDWSAYAATYDMLSDFNPAYRDLLAEFEGIASGIKTPEVIYDIGGGTGNYTQIAAEKFPASSVYLVEPDQGMRRRARDKLSACQNVSYIGSSLEEFEAPQPADLVICVHALYAMPAPQERLGDLRQLLRPGGILFLIDLGRVLNVAEWRSYLFGQMVKDLGVVKACRVLWQGREIAKQNKAIAKAQQEGVYWTHSGPEMSSFAKEAGFDVLKQKSVYRGYSDLLLCRAVS